MAESSSVIAIIHSPANIVVMLNVESVVDANESTGGSGSTGAGNQH